MGIFLLQPGKTSLPYPFPLAFSIKYSSSSHTVRPPASLLEGKGKEQISNHTAFILQHQYSGMLPASQALLKCCFKMLLGHCVDACLPAVKFFLHLKEYLSVFFSDISDRQA